MKCLTLIGLFMAAAISGLAQDLEHLKNAIPKPEISLSGGITASLNFYNTTQETNRNSPFNYMIAGNLNLNILQKITIPFSFSYIDKKAVTALGSILPPAYIQPFNRFSLKPKYKGFQLFIGTSTLNFSKYTLAGHRFDGIALTYKSDRLPFYGGIMYGNLSKEVLPPDSLLGQGIKPALKRNGFGMNFGIKKAKDFIEISYFMAQDKVNGIEYLHYNLVPGKNISAGLKINKLLSPNLIFHGEMGLSKIYYSAQLGANTDNNYTNLPLQSAVEGGLDYKVKNSVLGFNYSRIASNYSTYGAYYFNNDQEIYSLRLAQSFLPSNALSFQGEFGFQRKNLNNQMLQTPHSIVGSAALNYRLKDRLIANTSFSTFNNYINFNKALGFLTSAPVYQGMDTLNYQQINRNIQSNVKIFMDNQQAQSVTATFINQSGKNTGGSNVDANTMNNFIFMWNYNDKKRKLNYGAGYNFTHVNTIGFKNSNSGPTLSFSALVLKDQMQNSLQISYLKTSMETAAIQYFANAAVFNLRYVGSITIKKSHKIQLYASLVNKLGTITSTETHIPGFTENVYRIGYSYNLKSLKWTPSKKSKNHEK